jgi:hypothetical protein
LDSKALLSFIQWRKKEISIHYPDILLQLSWHLSGGRNKCLVDFKAQDGRWHPQNYYTCAKEFCDGEGPQVQNIPEVWGQTWLPPHPRPLILGITYHGALCDTDFHFSKHCGHKPKAPRLMEEGNVKVKKVTSSSNV